jgi:hypothetical protein
MKLLCMAMIGMVLSNGEGRWYRRIPFRGEFDKFDGGA